MQSTVIKPTSPFLKPYIEYFLLFKSEQQDSFYTTYPNHNLCLGIYKKNFFHLDKVNNEAQVFISNQYFQSTLVGHHTKPFNIKVAGSFEGICLILKMPAIRHLSAIPFPELINQEEVFERLFGSDALLIFEQIFQQTDDKKKCIILEKCLLPKFMNASSTHYVYHALDWINQHSEIRVEDLAKMYQVSRTKLFRDFKYHIGQSPKNFIETVRFRKALDLMKMPTSLITSLTELSYFLGYADQSHFIKDFTKMTGVKPSKFLSKTEVVNDNFIWTK